MRNVIAKTVIFENFDLLEIRVPNRLVFNFK